MNALDLCSGIGGLSLGVRLAAECRTVCYVEREAFAASVLVARMEAAQLDRAPIADDLRTFDGRAWRGCVDLVVAGYPCQPFSVAGKRRGEADERHLWPDVRRIIDECGASLVFLENVPGHLRLGFAEVLGDLAELGFDAEWGLFSAAEVGAPHKRERLFVLAHRDGWRQRLDLRSELLDGERPAQRHDADGCGADVADTGCLSIDGAQQVAERRRGDPAGAWTSSDAVGHPDDARLEGRGVRWRERADELPAWPPSPEDADGWRAWLERGGPLPVLRRGVDGPAAWLDRADRLRALGNAVVPLAAAHAFRTLAARACR